MDPAQRFADLVRSGPAAGVHLDELVGLVGACLDPARHDAVAEVCQRLDGLAAECEPTFGSILRTLFASSRLDGNRLDYGDPWNSYLHRVLERGLGIPITLAVCAMEVGRRLGVPVEGVGLPGHFVIRCEGVYADPFNGGRTIPADELEAEWRRVTGSVSPLDAGLLAPVHPRLLVLRVLNNLKNVLVPLDDPLALRSLAMLRSAFVELGSERPEHSRWLRHWN